MQEADGDIIRTVRENLSLVVVLVTVAVMALVQKLTGFFVTRREFNGLGKRLEGVETLRAMDQNTIADHNRRIDMNETEIRQVREFGSDVSRAVAETTERRLNGIEQLLARIDERLRFLDPRFRGRE